AALAAANCNPSYDVAEPGPCVKECKIKAGQDMWAQWTDDPASADFIESLSYKCERGTPAYTTYMTQSGMCVMNCSADEQADYGNREHADSCAWYQEHKDDTCAEASPSPSASADASESASASDNADATETSPSSNDDN
ncbi:hypothetical protein BDB00DRAFT_746836, partial [Zychaea mexicana]|uniref:uncharacterized protein n=1 Tax=Zychaea mexicana TaxID=64656 RepID=UPI0022FECCFD